MIYHFLERSGGLGVSQHLTISKEQLHPSKDALSVRLAIFVVGEVKLIVILPFISKIFLFLLYLETPYSLASFFKSSLIES